MVWKAASSTLYQAVERHNSGESKAHEARCGDSKADEAQCRDSKAHEAQCRDSKAHEAQCGDSKTHEAQCGESTTCHGQSTCPEPTKCRAEQHSSQPQSMLSGLLQDKDFLLLAAVMLILMHEKADNKLILALAFVLFA